METNEEVKELNPLTCIYDIETSNYLKDVHYDHGDLGFLCGIIIDLNNNLTMMFQDPYEMVKKLITNYEVIIGFNNKGFDNLVLGYTCSSYANPNREINFGKHKGTKWQDLPEDYLQWAYSNMTGHNKKIAKSALLLKKGEEIPNNNDTNLISKLNAKSLDLMEILSEKTGIKFPVSLNTLSKLTIGKEKPLSNADIPILAKEGRMQEIENYMLSDGDITKELIHFLATFGYCLIPALRTNQEDICLKVNVNLREEVLKVLNPEKV